MIHCLYEHPWLAAILLIGLAELYAIGLMLLCRKRWGMDRLRLNNEVAGHKFSVIGVLYTVLLAFVVVAVWENYHSTETAVRNEAKALVDLSHVSQALPEPAGSEIRTRIVEYAQKAGDTEWEAMASGEQSLAADAALHRLRKAIFGAEPDQGSDAVIFDHALKLLTVVNDNRNERLDSVDGSVPAALWVVLLTGALITLGYPSFFAASNLIAQALMTAALAALVALSLFVAILLDRPFAGGGQVSRAPFDQALKEISEHGSIPE
jgi:hypothetical protein